MTNEVFLYSGFVKGQPEIQIGLGSRGHMRRRQLTCKEALKLGRSLISAANGDFTMGRNIPLREL